MMMLRLKFEEWVFIEVMLCAELQAVAHHAEFVIFMCHFQTVASDFQLFVSALGQSFDHLSEFKMLNSSFLNLLCFFRISADHILNIWCQIILLCC